MGHGADLALKFNHERCLPHSWAAHQQEISDEAGVNEIDASQQMRSYWSRTASGAVGAPRVEPSKCRTRSTGATGTDSACWQGKALILQRQHPPDLAPAS